MARSFDGVTNSAESLISISGKSVITLSFWVWFDNYTVADRFFIEYARGSHNGFTILSKNSGTGGTSVQIQDTIGDVWQDSFTLLPTATWTHVAVLFDRTTPQNKVAVNGTNQSFFGSSHNPPGLGSYGTFGAPVTGLWLFSNEGGANTGAVGRMCELAIWNTDHYTSASAIGLSGANPLQVCPDDLLFYAPMYGDSPDPDYVGKKNLSISATTVAPTIAQTLGVVVGQGAI